jgi:hypothetical protein
MPLHCKALGNGNALNHAIHMQGNGTRPPGHLAYVSRHKKTLACYGKGI